MRVPMSDAGSGSDLAAMEARLARVEGRLRNFRTMLLLLLVLAAGTPAVLLLWPRNEITARTFLVRDANGRIRGMLGSTGGGVALTLLDSLGQMRADIGLAQSGTPSLLLLTGQGVPVATLNLQQDGGPFLRLTAPDNSHRLWLRAGHEAGPLLALLAGDSARVGFEMVDGAPSLSRR